MGAKPSQQKARGAELDITDIAANKSPPAAAAAAAAASITHKPTASSSSTSPALTSLSSNTSPKPTPQAWSAPLQSRYIQSDNAEDAVTQWKPDEEEKEEEVADGAKGAGAGGEDLFGKYKNASGGEGGALGKRSGIVSGVKAASVISRKPSQQQQITPGMSSLMEDEEGVDDSAVSTASSMAH